MAMVFLRAVVVALDGFLALTAAAGGVGLLAGINAPSVESLRGSPFRDYTIPGLSLLIVVGGVALLAAVLMIRRHWLAAHVSALAGVVIIGFEIVEVLVIASPAGVARTLQIFYFSLGLVIALLVGAWWLVAGREAPNPSRVACAGRPGQADSADVPLEDAFAAGKPAVKCVSRDPCLSGSIARGR